MIDLRLNARPGR